MRILGVLVVGLLGASALAGHRVERVPVEQMPAPKPPEPRVVAPGVEKPKAFDKAVKLSLRDVTLEEARVAACKALSITLTARRNPGMPDVATSGPPIVYDLDIDATELDQALDQLGRSLKMAVYRNGQDYTLSATDSPGFANARRSVVPENPVENPDQGPPSARIEGTQIYRYIPIRQGQQNLDSASVQISLWPGDRGSMGRMEVRVLEAVDEQDRSLVSEPEGMNRNPFVQRDLRLGRQLISARIQMLNPASTKIARLRAEAILNVPKSYDRLIVEGFDDKPINATMGGMPLQLTPPELTPQGWRIGLRVDRTANEDQGKSAPLFRPNYEEIRRMVFLTADGKPLIAEPAGGGKAIDNWWETQIIVRPANTPRRPGMPRVPATAPDVGPEAPAFPKPASLTWDAVAETRQVVVPVEARDIPLP
jgi:hypothetical protein